MRTNEIIADFTNQGTNTRTKPLIQYDHGMQLRIKGTELSEPCTVHFAPSPDAAGSFPEIAQPDNGDLLVAIPDNLLGDDASQIYAYLYKSEGDSGYTVYTAYTPIIMRARPDGYVPTQADWDSFTAALEAVNQAAESIEEAERAIEDCELTAVLTPISGGYRLDVHDKNGDHTAYIMNGADGQPGPAGPTGSQGPAGADGRDGQDGFSPTANVTKTGSTATITIIDKNGTTTAAISDGQNGRDGHDGSDGQDGFSPTASVTKSGTTATITITDKNGTTTATVSDGQNGQDGTDGTDGFSPTVTITTITGGHRITITDKNGSHTADVMDGADGQDGDDGRGIVSVTKTGTSGLIDTYTITYTDNTTSTFTVTNGEDGDDYVLTNQDKQDIADIVVQLIGSADTTSY